MKAASAGMITHIAGETTTLATLWRIARQDGQVFVFTDHDLDIVYSGLTYSAAAGYTPGAIRTSAGLAVDNLDLIGVLDSPAITVESLLAGDWDGAEIRISRINWQTTADGVIELRRGWLGEVRTEGAQFTAELRGMTQRLQQPTGRCYSPACDADLGDARCKVNLATYTVTGTVTSVVSARRFTDSVRGEATGHFDAGKLAWTSGENTGRGMDVKTFTSGGEFLLSLPMPSAIVAGDTYSVYRGCKKRFAEDCVAIFNNGDNNRSFPHTPGLDQILRGP